MMTSLLQLATLTLVLVGGSAVGRWIESRVGLASTSQAEKILELDGELQ